MAAGRLPFPEIRVRLGNALSCNNIGWNFDVICALLNIGSGVFHMQAKNNIGPADQLDAPIALVAEDEVLLRLALADYLRDAGFQVLEAANATEAQLIMAAADRVDVVISDVHMAQPGEGFELALWFAANFPEVPVILTSGSRGAQQSPQLATLVNVTDFVPKPYSREAMEKLARSRMRVD